MSLHRLEVFVYVAKHLHITHAADELRISQPSVSRHLKLLEDEFGVFLHRKLSQGIELTPEGEAFLKGAQAVLAQYQQLKENFANNHPGTERRYLKIGSSFAPSITLVPAVLGAFGRSHPDVGIVIKTGISEELEQWVLRGRIDLAFITKPANLDSLVYESCGTGEVLGFVSAKHPLAEKSTLKLSDLRITPLVVRTRTGDRPTRTWKQLQALASGAGPLSIAIDCDSHRSVRHAVRRGKGLGFGYRDYLARDIKSGALKALKLDGFQHSYENFVIYAKEPPLSEAAEHFLALVRRKNSKSRRSLLSQSKSPT